jgi:hypothetical protein
VITRHHRLLIFIGATLYSVAAFAVDLQQDSDGDGLTDMEETKIYHTDIHRKDTDSDGLPDGEEIDEYLTDPLVTDTDGDGYLDGVEALNGSDPTDPDSIPKSNDLDKDGISNKEETDTYHTDPQRPDTDFDGLTDAQEVFKYFTNPTMVDTDGDSYWDGEEVRAGTDPQDPFSFPGSDKGGRKKKGKHAHLGQGKVKK